MVDDADLKALEGPQDEPSPSERSSAALEQELQDAYARLGGERLVFLIVLVIAWDAHTFKSYSSWAPCIALLVLELLAIFILAYRFKMHSVIQLFWGAIRGYAQKDPGNPPSPEQTS